MGLEFVPRGGETFLPYAGAMSVTHRDTVTPRSEPREVPPLLPAKITASDGGNTPPVPPLRRFVKTTGHYGPSETHSPSLAR
jgi:hypothetical protein